MGLNYEFILFCSVKGYFFGLLNGKSFGKITIPDEFFEFPFAFDEEFFPVTEHKKPVSGTPGHPVCLADGAVQLMFLYSPPEGDE
jgi:hypothetical protein